MQFQVVHNSFVQFQAVSFKKSSRNLARSLWLKNIKLTIIIIIIVIVSTYLINLSFLAIIISY